MTLDELQSMTVLELRKLARDRHIRLGAGIDKAGIVQRLAESILTEGSTEDGASGTVSASAASDLSEATADESSAESSGPKFQAAWHNTASPRYNQKPAYQAPGSVSNHSSWQNTSPSGRQLFPEQRIQPTRPGTTVPRFGPSAASADTFDERPQESVPKPLLSPLPERRFNFGGEGNGFGPRAASTYTASYNPPSHSAELPGSSSAVSESSSAPTLEELLASGDYVEGGGILELHPDGYGFLRASNFLPSSRDVYVSMAQIRRLSLRTGDYVAGKIRPQREGDKYAAMLYISSVNGLSEEETLNRPLFDDLTPAYPSRRISLESGDGKSLPDMRLVDLIAPLGFGQRGLLLCPPDTGKTDLIRNFARVISNNYPEVNVFLLQIDVNPEDVTLMRDSVPCPVLASTFDQAPEAHLRLVELVLERAMRLVEQKKDVVLLVDSLTRLAKIYTTAAVQQGRNLPGMVNPTSLFKAKRLFGAARACKEGGSLTVIAAMDISTGSKVDDSVVEEFKGTANMELTLDAAVARVGIIPAINLARSFTKNADILLDEQQKTGLSLIRTMLGNTSSAVAVPQIQSMMEKASTNADLLLKMKDWFALMNR